MGGAAVRVAVLSDLDFFWLGAVSKLGTRVAHFPSRSNRVHKSQQL